MRSLAIDERSDLTAKTMEQPAVQTDTNRRMTMGSRPENAIRQTMATLLRLMIFGGKVLYLCLQAVLSFIASLLLFIRTALYATS